MKIKTLIIDDEPIALEKLRSYVSKVPFLELVGECQSALEAVEVLSATEIDVIFTDINMPDLDGMGFISSLPHPPMVVFCTAYSEYAVESYRLSAVGYLLKPYGFPDFQRVANRVLDIHRMRTGASAAAGAAHGDESIFVKVDYRYLRVSLPDIVYIKGYGEYLQIFLNGNPSPLLTLSSFAAIKEKLPGEFVQIHRSYIVNMNRVQRIEKSRVIIDEDTYLPVGDSYKNDFLQYVARHAVGNASRKEQ